MKYALKTKEGELAALAAYEILENNVMVHITYIESQPESNPTIVGHSKKYFSIGRVLIMYGIKLCQSITIAAVPLLLKQKLPNWPNTMSAISRPSRCQVLVALQDSSFLAKL